jgi:hypothetical protein
MDYGDWYTLDMHPNEKGHREIAAQILEQFKRTEEGRQLSSAARPDLGISSSQRRLADLERIAAEIVAVQLNKVEGIQEHNGVVSAVTDAIEIRHSSIVAGAKTLECTGQSAGVSDQRVWMRQNNGVIVNQLPTPVIL